MGKCFLSHACDEAWSEGALRCCSGDAVWLAAASEVMPLRALAVADQPAWSRVEESSCVELGGWDAIVKVRSSKAQRVRED